MAWSSRVQRSQSGSLGAGRLGSGVWAGVGSAAEGLDEFGTRDLFLLAASEVLDGEDAGGEFVLADDDHALCEFVRGLKGAAEAEGALAEFDVEAGGAEFSGELEGSWILGDAHGSDKGVEEGRRLVGAFGLSLEQQEEAVFADGEADARGFGAAEELGEAVVATAAEQGVLGAEACAVGHGELEGGAGVVVEAANEAWVFGERNVARGEGLFDLREVLEGVGVEKVGDAGERLDDGLIGGVFGVEDAEGVGFGAAAIFRAELLADGSEGGAEGFGVAGAVGWGADGVELELPTLDAEGIEEGGEHFEELGVADRAVGSGPGGSEDFDADLPELAIAAALWSLAAEHGADVEELLEGSGLVEFVFDVGADDAGGVFGSEGE